MLESVRVIWREAASEKMPYEMVQLPDSGIGRHQARRVVCQRHLYPCEAGPATRFRRWRTRWSAGPMD